MSMTWSDYMEIKSWNESFERQIINEIEALDEDDIHHIFSLFQNELCDREIHHITGVHEFIIYKIRVGAVFTEIGQLYNYPIVFSRELMINRLITLVREEGADPVTMINMTGAHPNLATEIYNKYRQTPTNVQLFNKLYTQQKQQQSIEDRTING